MKAVNEQVGIKVKRSKSCQFFHLSAAYAGKADAIKVDAEKLADNTDHCSGDHCNE